MTQLRRIARSISSNGISWQLFKAENICQATSNSLPHAKLANEIPKKLTFPPPEVYVKANKICRQMDERNVKNSQTEAADNEDGKTARSNTASVATCFAV